jgi:serine/threonine protein kinase
MRRPVVPGYDIVGALGKGAYGRVYRAIDSSNGRVVAIKVVESLPESIKSLVREVQALHHQLENPFVVRLYDYNVDSQTPYVAMELCDFGTLADWAEQERPWWQVAAVLLHAAAGLRAIHDAGGFHRDIKPQNLLMTRTEHGLQVKLGDFGLSRIPNTSPSAMTASPAGTPGYWAPEIESAMSGYDDAPYTAAADIYSLGVTGIELLTGQRDRARVNDEDCPEQFKRLLLAMVAIEPTGRPRSSVVVDELRAILQKRALNRQGTVTTSDPEADAEHPTGALFKLFILGAIVVLGVAVATALTSDEDE